MSIDNIENFLIYSTRLLEYSSTRVSVYSNTDRVPSLICRCLQLKSMFIYRVGQKS